ncbi:MAG: VIT domain-containing protein, partial [Verrucomicrobiota bacterium]
MNAWRFIVMLLMLPAVLGAAPTQFSEILYRTGARAGKPMEFVALDVVTQIHGAVATTDLTFTVRNPDGDWAEGEMYVDLEPGDEIAGFQLEVGDEFRDSVSVSRSYARSVYQSIVNRRIDPGIVEWVGENRYRINIYPVATTRSFKLQIDHRVWRDGDQHVWRLPLKLPEETELSFDFQISGNEGDAIKTESRDEIVISYRAADAELTSGEFFCIVPAIAPDPKVPPEIPNKVTIFWDCSRSSAARDREQELKALEQDLAGKEVSWVMFDVAERTRGEGLTSLREAVETQPPDGGTDFGAVDFGAEREGAIILVSDGKTTIGQLGISDPSAPVFAYCHSYEVDGYALRRVANESGGAFFDLAAGNLIRDDAPLKTGKRSGPTPNQQLPNLLQDYARRAWARNELARLGSPWQSGHGVINDHCREHRLASRWSSLLVLERAHDYVQAGIRPPEGELAEYYDKQRERSAKQSAPTYVLEQFQKWYATDFPNVDPADYDVWKPEFDERIGAQKWDIRWRKWNIQRKRDFAKALAKHAGDIDAQTDILLQSQGMISHGWGGSDRVMAPRNYLTNLDGIDFYLNRHSYDAFADTSNLAGASRTTISVSAAPKEQNGGGSNNTAKTSEIVLKSWDGSAGVSAAFEKRAIKDWPKVYQQQLDDRGGDLAFFLDVAEVLWRAGHRDLAIRAISNLVELGFGNALELRRAAMRLAAWEEHELAASVFERIRELEPESLIAD